MKENEIRNIYTQRYYEMQKIIPNLNQAISDAIQNEKNVKIDQRSCRIKDIDSFIKKAMKVEDGRIKYNFPFSEIQDQIGVRIVIYYINNVEPLANLIKEYFNFIEEKRFPPETYKEFSYEGRHFVLNLGDHIYPNGIDKSLIPDFFELQIKTLFQHAWSQAEHDLGYKEDRVLEFNEKRKLAFAAAQAWGADRIFSEILYNG